MNKKLFPGLALSLALLLNSQMGALTAAVAKKADATTTAAKAGKAKTPISVKIVNVTSPVKAGSDATVTVETDPDALCRITVKYKSGPASAAGLKAQHADSAGKASWTWKVAKNTAAGDWPVEVTASAKGSKATATGSLKVEK